MARSIVFLLLAVVLVASSERTAVEENCHFGWDKTGVPREHVDEG